jgi:PilZ domain
MATAAGNRQDHRQRVLKSATILNGISNSEVKCAVRNMHPQGAELEVEGDSRVPNEFLLYIPLDGIAYKATVRWRRHGRIGVMFTGTEPKPAWHYG